MEINKTKCAEEIPYIEVGTSFYELTFYQEDKDGIFDIDIEDLIEGGGATIKIEKKDMMLLIDFLKTEVGKLT